MMLCSVLAAAPHDQHVMDHRTSSGAAVFEASAPAPLVLSVIRDTNMACPWSRASTSDPRTGGLSSNSYEQSNVCDWLDAPPWRGSQG
ncbi:uncharacterized protein EI97DRAFT_216503 [Westerdykella ornata]|uniref:Uncharacterized protein n=1 Tax=Westerdykella ornata TaxID=318751 RepID=A0A6A6JR04_WESOR|nr:uncharacterized protein EI97DRAFT_216503 [Westerdykella ornata]KAF2278674.1 hypothetical protein EI97DRAFT_216503 [Westerdykella ornata]